MLVRTDNFCVGRPCQPATFSCLCNYKFRNNRGSRRKYARNTSIKNTDLQKMTKSAKTNNKDLKKIKKTKTGKLSIAEDVQYNKLTLALQKAVVTQFVHPLGYGVHMSGDYYSTRHHPDDITRQHVDESWLLQRFKQHPIQTQVTSHFKQHPITQVTSRFKQHPIQTQVTSRFKQHPIQTQVMSRFRQHPIQTQVTSRFKQHPIQTQ